MRENPLFAAEIKIVNDLAYGMHFECSEKYSAPICQYLTGKGFHCGQPSVVIQETRKIHSLVSIPVDGRNAAGLETAIKAFCKSNGAHFSEQRAALEGESTVTLFLRDVSIYDK
jgi:hypothetical protein